MTPTVSEIASTPAATAAGSRVNALAERLEEGARALAAFAATLTDAQWQARIPGDGRKVGVVVHHVASMYPVEIQVAQVLAKGQPVTGVTWAVIDSRDAVGILDAAHYPEPHRSQLLDKLAEFDPAVLVMATADYEPLQRYEA